MRPLPAGVRIFVVSAFLLTFGCGQKLSEADRRNLDKVTLGMSESEVTAMLPPNPRQSTSPGGDKVLTWGPEGNHVSVLFFGGKVSTIERKSSSSEVNWGPVLGLAGVVLLVIGGAVFGVLRLRRRRAGATR